MAIKTIVTYDEYNTDFTKSTVEFDDSENKINLEITEEAITENEEEITIKKLSISYIDELDTVITTEFTRKDIKQFIILLQKLTNQMQ